MPDEPVAEELVPDEPDPATQPDPAVQSSAEPPGPSSAASTGEAGEPGHDATGLDVARVLAARLRAVGRRPAARTWRSGRAGDASTMSGAHPDGRDPTRVGKLVDKLVHESGWQTDVAVHAVIARWAEIVGTEVASHCTPQSFDDATLTVRADSTAWATQLKLLASAIVRRLNAELGQDTVRFVHVLGPDAPSWRRGGRSVRDGRGPRDTYG